MVKKSVTKLEHKKGNANMVTAKHIVEMLDLKPHPTCGFVAETYRSKHKIPQQALPAAYEGSRPFGSVLYLWLHRKRKSVCTASDPTRCTTITSATHWRCCCYIRVGAAK
jgi:hypothetical protein